MYGHKKLKKDIFPPPIGWEIKKEYSSENLAKT